MKRIALLLLATLAGGCPFNNPYEYYGQECDSADQCGDVLDCVEGQCVGRGCSAEDPCEHSAMECVAGRCILPELDDATVADAASAKDRWQPDRNIGGDVSAVDTTAGDSWSRDTAVPDSWRPDTETTRDVFVVHIDGAVPDAGPGDGGDDDRAATDRSGTDATSQVVRCDTAPFTCPEEEPFCLNGFCVPESCTHNSECHKTMTQLICHPELGVCTPENCQDHGSQCWHPLLLCQSDGSCLQRQGKPYESCVATEGEPNGWCAEGLVCSDLWSQEGVGMCAQECHSTGGTECPMDNICVPLGQQGSLQRGGRGVCLQRCSVTLNESDQRAFAVGCSVTDGTQWSHWGTWLPMSQKLLGATCNDGYGCGSPFVCARKRYETGTGVCMLLPEALAWQALGAAEILPQVVATDEVCPAGLVRAQTSESGNPGVCLPRCRDDQDCTLAVPHDPYCYRHSSSDSAGFCSTEYNGSCWLSGFGEVAGECEPATIDSDGDGFPDDMEACDSDFGVTNGCPGPGMCRVNEECGSNAFCVDGWCQEFACQTSCSDDQEYHAVTSCNPNGICLAKQHHGGMNMMTPCLEDTDCSGDPLCSGGGCVCLANYCQPKTSDCGSSDSYYGSCADWVMGNIPCASAIDCPGQASCDSHSNTCQRDYFALPDSCDGDTDCGGDGRACLAGFCAEPTNQADCWGEYIGDHCLDCFLVNGPNAPWSLPISGVSNCPCGMERHSNVCYGTRVRCPSGDSDECPGGHTCYHQRCVEQQLEPCPIGYEQQDGVCINCMDAMVSPMTWDLPCFSSGQGACPCGLLCLPDSGGDGVCASPYPEFMCINYPDAAKFHSCDRDGVVMDGACREYNNQEIFSCTECNGQSCYLHDGVNFCGPAGFPTCGTVGGPCSLGVDVAATCVETDSSINNCLPSFMLPSAAAGTGAACQNQNLFASCGAGCICIESGGTPIPTELYLTSCGTSPGIGFGCLSDMNLPSSLSGTASQLGHLCSAGQHPGQYSDYNGSSTCLPTGSAPSTMCGFAGAGIQCPSSQVCQLGECFQVAQSSCSDSATENITPEQSSASVCRLKEQEIPSCSPYSPFCAYSFQGSQGSVTAVEGGICVESPDGTASCFPRVGCDLAAPGEVCVADAPIPAHRLQVDSCMPWKASNCAFARGACAMGTCHPTDNMEGFCLPANRCNHWLECGGGEVCSAGRCLTHHSDAQSGPCDAQAWGGTAGGGQVLDFVCHLKNDPRCFGLSRGAMCQGLSNQDGWMDAAGVCTSDAVCASVESLYAPTCTNDGDVCTATSGSSGHCSRVPDGNGTDSFVCVP